MKKLFAFLKNTWWLFLLLFLAPFVVITVFAVKEYIFHQIDMSAGDWASLWGSAFGYWGTVVLGTLAFWQNIQVQENNDILINYEKQKMAPVFSLALEGYKGMLQNLKFILSNSSDNIACSFEISDLNILKIDDKEIASLICKTPVIKSDKISVLEAHSQIELECQNNVIEVKNGEIILLILRITASDIVGVTRITEVRIYINDKLKCKYEYLIQNIHEQCYEEKKIIPIAQKRHKNGSIHADDMQTKI